MLLTKLFVYATYNTRHNLTLAMARNLFFIKSSHGVHTSMFSTSAYKNRKVFHLVVFKQHYKKQKKDKQNLKRKRRKWFDVLASRNFLRHVKQ